MTVFLSVGYCTVSSVSVAAPPRHPAPSISNTSVTVYSVGARECGFAIRLVRVLHSVVHSRIASREKKI